MATAREQLINLVKAIDIDYLLAPILSTDDLVNLGTLVEIPNAELKSGASLVSGGLLSGTAAILLDGVSGYLDINWEPEKFSDDLTFFGLANLENEDGENQIAVWFCKLEDGDMSVEIKVVKGTTGTEGSLFPFGIALRILTPEEIESLATILSEVSSTAWKNLGVVVDSTLTGVVLQIPSDLGVGFEIPSTGVSSL